MKRKHPKDQIFNIQTDVCAGDTCTITGDSEIRQVIANYQDWSRLMIAMGTIVSGLLIAGVTALTALAYNKPKEYRKISLILILLLAVILTAIVVQDLTIERVRVVAGEFVDPGRKLAANEALDKLFWVSDSQYWFLMGLLFYLYVLDTLPLWLTKSESSEK
jgi:hypothetical protein